MEENLTCQRTIHVVIADDHALFSASLRRLLELVDDIRVMAEFGDAKALLSGMNGLMPDVLILDLNMPNSDPLEIVAWVQTNCPSTAVVGLTAFDDDRYLGAMESSSIAGFLPKAASPEMLIAALRRVAGGETIWTQEERSRARRWREEVESRWLNLTARESAVARLAARGMDTKQIAEALQITPRTAEYHMGNVLDKVGVSSRLAVAAWIRDNLPEDWWREPKTR